MPHDAHTVEQIWRQEELDGPARQPKRGRLWLIAGLSVRLRPPHRNLVWSYDYGMGAAHDRRPLRMLSVIDAYTRELLTMKMGRTLPSEDAQDCPTELFCNCLVPRCIRSDNSSEFAAKRIRGWLEAFHASRL